MTIIENLWLDNITELKQTEKRILLEIIDEKDVRKRSRGECHNKKCYKCDRFRACLILNGGGGLLPRT